MPILAVTCLEAAMSYSGSDDQLLCDYCLAMGHADLIRPWPVSGPLLDRDGGVTAGWRDCFSICGACTQALVLSAPLEPRARDLAERSAARWEASQRLQAQAEAVVRGPVPGCRGAA
jgi:hypothetical protein